MARPSPCVVLVMWLVAPIGAIHLADRLPRAAAEDRLGQVPGARGEWQDCLASQHMAPMPDAGQPCSDGSDCGSEICIVEEAVCGGRAVKYPYGEGWESCQLKARCSGWGGYPTGCRGYLKKGMVITWCAD